MKTTTMTKEEKKFYNSIVRTVGKDSIRDIMRYGAGNGYPGITYTWDCEKFVKNNKNFIRDLIQNDILDGVLVRSDYFLHRSKLDDVQTTQIDSFVFLGRWDKNFDFMAVSWLCWYAIESFLHRFE